MMVDVLAKQLAGGALRSEMAVPLLNVTAVWSVGQQVLLQECCDVTQPLATHLQFKPLGSRAVARCLSGSTSCAFTADLGGDYVVASATSNASAKVARWLVHAINWTDQYAVGTNPTLLADTFQRQGATESSDNAVQAWMPVGTAHQAAGRLVLGPGDAMLATRTQNFFAQPLVTVVDGVLLGKELALVLSYAFAPFDTAAAAAAALNFTAHGIYLQVGAADIVLRVLGGSGRCNHVARCTLATLPTPACLGPDAQPLRVVLKTDDQNVSVKVSCGTGTGSAGANVSVLVQHTLYLGGAPPDPRTGLPSGASRLSVAAIFVNGTGAASSPAASLLTVGGFRVLSGVDFTSLPRVLGATADLIPVGPDAPDLGPAHAELLRKGMLDVTLPPFSADKFGNADSTEAIQRALNFGYANYLVTFFPVGRYIVSQTLNATQYSRLGRMGPRFACHQLRGELLPAAPDARATLVLANSTPGFTTDPLLSPNPRPVLRLWHLNPAGASQPNINMNQGVVGLDVDLGHGNVGAVGIEDRGAQGSSLQGVTIFARDAFAGIAGGSGSGGSHIAVTVVGGRYGIDYRGTQPASTISGFKLVNQTCGGILYCGLMALSIVGLELSSAYPTFEHAIVSGPVGSNPSHTLKVPASLECSAPQTGGWCPSIRPLLAVHGQLSLVDCILDGGTAATGGAQRTAIVSASNTLYLKNSYFRGFEALSTFTRSGHTFALPMGHRVDRWTSVGEYAHGEPASPLKYTMPNGTHVQLQLRAPIVRDGTRSEGADLLDVASTQPEHPPLELRGRHLYGPEASFPSVATPDAIDVTRAPYFARGDGVHDDAAAINAALARAAQALRTASSGAVVFLPKGVFRIGHTLSVPQGVALVGTAHHLCVLLPTPGFSDAVQREGRTSAPLVHMLGPIPGAPHRNASGRGRILGSTLSQIMMGVFDHDNHVRAWEWQAEGDGNVLRQCATWIMTPALCQMAARASDCPPNPSKTFGVAMTAITGAGAGRFYVVHHEDGWFENPAYRHLLVTGTGNGRRAFYHLNIEHAQSDANAEIRDGGGYATSNLTLFSTIYHRGVNFN